MFLPLSLSLSLQDMLTPLRRGVCVYTLIQGFWNVFSVILSAARGCRGILQSASNEDTAVFL